MSVYHNRFLVMIGGETTNEDKPIVDSTEVKSVKKEDENVNLSGSENKPEEAEDANKPLNDVWLYDIHLETWREISPAIRVQTSFNSKKMRKIFEPRMAHSATVLGNYIVVFGGYNSQSNQYSPNNLYILSLSGCTDYILPKPYTLKML